jgi:bifunctional DNase/RNase
LASLFLIGQSIIKTKIYIGNTIGIEKRIKMKRKQVKILGLSYSQSQSGSYVVVLSEKKGDRKVPIIVKPNEAQNIAVKIEGIKSSRPSTHDLIKSVTDTFSIDIQEVYIYALLEGVFYTKIISSNGVDEIEIECTIGDGLALALTYKCPIWIKSDVLENAGIIIDYKDTDSEDIDDDDSDLEMTEDSEKAVLTEDDLTHMMDDAIKSEEYELAAELRDRIQKMKDNG